MKENHTKSKYSKKKKASYYQGSQKIVKIISEWKKRPAKLARGKKMVEAVVIVNGEHITRHLAVNK